jgi:hypothetical protein
MNRQFEDALADCLEALTQGRRTLDQCLALYPQWAQRLEPLLRVAATLGRAYAADPSPARQAEARQRFLAAARARQALALGPRRSLLAIPWAPRLPRPALRPVLAALALVVFTFAGFSSFTLATAGDALPGDWRYPVKRFTERARLTFVFGEDARRSFRIGLTEERLKEVEGLAAKGESISEPVLQELADNTGSLVEELDPVAVPQDQIERIGELTAKQQDVLDEVQPLVEEEAADDLEEAKQVSSEAYGKAVQALALAHAEEEPPEEEVTTLTTPESSTRTAEAGAGASPTAGAEADESPSAEATPTPEQGVDTGTSATPTPEQDADTGTSATPTPEPTLVPTEPSPVPGEPTLEPPSPTATASAPERHVIFLPDDTTAGIAWNLMTIGDFSVRVPADGEGDWAVSSLTGSGGESIFVGHRLSGRFDAAVVIQVSTGEASVHALVEGAMQRVPADEMPCLVSRPVANPVADAICHVLESINAGP